MAITRSIFFLVAAIVCFVIALLLTLGAFSGGNIQAWEIGGFLSLALSFLPQMPTLQYLNTTDDLLDDVHGRHAKDLIVLHETVSPDAKGWGDVTSVVEFLDKKGYGIHGLTDLEGHAAWAYGLGNAVFYQAGGVNERSIGIEQVSNVMLKSPSNTVRAHVWAARKPQLRATAKVIACISRAQGVEIKYSDGTTPGVTSHWDVSQHFPSSEGHTDCWPKHRGGYYPILEVINMAKAYKAAGWKFASGLSMPIPAPTADALANQSYAFRVLDNPRTGDAFLMRAAIQALAQQRANALFGGVGLPGKAPKLNDVQTGDPLLAGSWLSANLADSPGAAKGTININPQAIWGLATDTSPYHNLATNYVPHEMAHLHQSQAVLGREDLREGGAQAFADMTTPGAAKKAHIPYQPGRYDSNYSGFAQAARKLGAQWLLKGQFG